MTSLRCRRPFDEESDFTYFSLDGDEEATLAAILLATLGRQGWEVQELDEVGEWVDLELED